MSLTREQVQANIEAMERQGASYEDVNEYIQSLGQQQRPDQTISKRPGLMSRIGSFLAPTTAGLISDARSGEQVSGRQVAGSALEVGSLALPTGMAVRGVAMAGRGARAGLQRVPGGQTVLDKAKEVGSRFGRSVKTGATVGGASGGMFGAAQEIADEDAGLGDVAGGAAIGTGIGIVGGAAVGGVTSIGMMAIPAANRYLSSLPTKFRNTIGAPAANQANEVRVDAFFNAFYANKSGQLNALQKVVTRSRATGGPTNQRELIKEFAETYDPLIQGNFGDTTPAIDDIGARISTIARSMEPHLSKNPTITTATSLKERALDAVRRRIDIEDTVKAEREVEKLFTNIVGDYGENLTAAQLNQIRQQMGATTRAFNKQTFKSDAANEIRSVMRTRILDIEDSPVIADALAQQTKLYRMRDVANTMNNKKADVGFLESAAGRYLGLLSASAAGFSAGGPGALLVAGLAANLGQQRIAAMIRQQRFNRVTEDMIKAGFRQDSSLLNRLLENATPDERRVISDWVARPGQDVGMQGGAGTVQRGDVLSEQAGRIGQEAQPNPQAVTPDAPTDVTPTPGAQQGTQGAAAAVFGLSFDEEGNVEFDEAAALAGLAGMTAVQKSARKQQLEESLQSITDLISRTANQTIKRQYGKARDDLKRAIQQLDQ